nr:hypothetical protein B0A51_05896 [Rachicladosporium sp. CCFEE 5018]
MSENMDVITCPIPPVDTLDGFTGLFGYPIAHSLSPLLHTTIYNGLKLNWTYFPLSSTDIPGFLDLVRHPKCRGSGVTMPHKVAIIPFLDELTDEGQAVGACNTIVKRDGKPIGTNTDTIGVRESFLQNVAVPEQVYNGRPGLVIGGGGAARSAVYALVKLGCQTVYLVNRDPAEVAAVVAWCTAQGYGSGLRHILTAAEAEALEGPGAIVSCVPNFPPVTPAEIEARKVIEVLLGKPHKGAILEMCYHPTVHTEIGDLAQKAGWQVILGTEAMLYQGFEQVRYWTGIDVKGMPVAAAKDAIAAALRDGVS